MRKRCSGFRCARNRRRARKRVNRRFQVCRGVGSPTALTSRRCPVHSLPDVDVDPRKPHHLVIKDEKRRWARSSPVDDSMSFLRRKPINKRLRTSRRPPSFPNFSIGARSLRRKHSSKCRVQESLSKMVERVQETQ